MSVKRKDLVKELERNGWSIKREGGDHTIYTNGQKSIPVQRHRTVTRNYANLVCKQADLERRF